MEPVSLYDLVSDAVAELGALARRARSRSPNVRRGAQRRTHGRRRPARAGAGGRQPADQRHPAFAAGSEISVHRAARRRRRRADRRGRRRRHPREGPVEDLPGRLARDPARTPELLEGRSAGAGLGLAIVQGIVEAHAGEISVQQHARRLPLRRAAAAPRGRSPLSALSSHRHMCSRESGAAPAP